MPNGATFHIVTARLMPLVAILALLMLPVDLRAGASQSHPHAILQVIDDAADGVLDHDHGAPDQGYGAHDHDHAHDHAAASPAQTGGSPDLPRFAADAESFGTGLTATLAPLPLGPAEAAPQQRLKIFPLAWRGIARRPPIPPPRLVRGSSPASARPV